DKEESERVYKESQKQRYLEREIRRAKKEKAAIEAMRATEEDLKKANAKIRQKQANMRAFIEDTGRTRRYQREQIH
uniref:phage minor capsid protein n=1 Tax=Atopococcus tabaci TaxID=269774 RepID=UPI00240A6D31